MRRTRSPAGQHQRRLTGIRSGILEVQSVRTPVQMSPHWATRKEKYLCGTGARRGPQPATAGPTHSLLMILRRIVGRWATCRGPSWVRRPRPTAGTRLEGGGGHGGNLVILDNKLYAIGGLLSLSPSNLSPRRRVGFGKMLCVRPNDSNPTSDKWSGIASMKHGRFAAGAAAMGGKIYVLGGTAGWEWPDPAWHENELAEVYDPGDRLNGPPSRG